MKSDLVRICLVSNITLEPFILSHLRIAFSPRSINLKSISWVDALISPDMVRGYDLVVVMPNLEAQYPDWYSSCVSSSAFSAHLAEECMLMYRKLKEHVTCSILWFGYEGESNPIIFVCGAVAQTLSFIDGVNLEVASIFDKDDIFLDTRHLLASIGITNAYDTKCKYRWNMPYSRQMMKKISYEISKQYRALNGLTKKCLILDCDGVLWGGTLAEDGAANILLGSEGFGRPFQDFQRFLLNLYHHGVLLAICSKNDLQDVKDVFRSHGGMVLREENVVCFQVNWNSKADNICEIAKKLQIGLDSMIFLDDTDSEVAAVRSLLPEVLSIRFDFNTVYSELSIVSCPLEKDPLYVSRRMETYRTNEKRELLRQDSSDTEEYLKALETHVEIHGAEMSEVSRIAELTQRTNRCTNGQRYSASEVIACLNDPKYRLYSVYVSDRFSDLGLVGAIGIRESVLTLFALSCRALGRGVEREMLKQEFMHNIVESVFFPTGKNSALKDQLIKGQLLCLN